jgi:hypothetical protein
MFDLLLNKLKSNEALLYHIGGDDSSLNEQRNLFQQKKDAKRKRIKKQIERKKKALSLIQVPLLCVTNID